MGSLAHGASLKRLRLVSKGGRFRATEFADRINEIKEIFVGHGSVPECF